MTVYIQEAHPVEDNEYTTYIPQIKQQAEMSERIKAAEKLFEMSPIKLNENCPVLIDFMTNEANKAYAALPDRLYGIQNGKVVYDGGIGPVGYDLNKLEKWLNENA